MIDILKTAKILIVEDEAANLLLLKRILERKGFTFIEATQDPREALALFQSFEPDLICTDYRMPHLNGLELIDNLNEHIPEDSYLPIVMLTAEANAELEREALAKGAKDFLTKPFKANQIEVRISNLLHTRMLHRALQQQNDHLEALVRERTIELEIARLDVLERLALASEYRDYTTGQHTQRVGDLSARIARELGLPEEEAELIERAACLHDVGKIGIPDEILLKPGKLSESEWFVMKGHVELGTKLLSMGKSPLVKMAELIAFTHHERYDGSGYPRGLKGEAIPLVGQIVAVADVFDTLVNDRPYKRAWTVEEALSEMERQRGRWFSPKVLNAFFKIVETDVVRL